MRNRIRGRVRRARRGWRGAVAAGVLAWLPAGPVAAADLPPHRPLRVIVVSDEVNPHMLPDADLTQPGDLSAALLSPGTGLHLDAAADAVVEIATNDIEQATALLEAPRGSPAAYDVLLYFAHRIPDNGNDAVGRQDAFTAAVEAFLGDGGGVVSFHHGAYAAAGKEGILDLIGATASGAVPWNTVDGQDVINVSPEHFVTCNGVDYPGTRTFGSTVLAVVSDTYPVFNNTPDERYPTFSYNPSAAGSVETLFASDYNENGTEHLLGFVHRRPEWVGPVVAYQPGEYQPQALDDVDGNNFQILANAILFAAGALPPDSLVLALDHGLDPEEAVLAWWACDSDVRVFRSTDPATVTDPVNELTQTSASPWPDLPPAGTLHYYRLLRP